MRRRERMMDELDEDIREHIERETQENIERGMAPEEARRRAFVKFGSVTRVKEETREVWSVVWLEQLWQDVLYGLRMLRKSPGFTAVAVLTLALGIGASTVGFSVFYNLLFNAFAAKNSNRLVIPIVLNTESLGDKSWVRCSLSDLALIREHNHVFENVVGSGPLVKVLLKDGRETYQVNGARVTSDAFEFYGVPALLGRDIQPADGKPGAPPVFVMSYGTWKGSFSGDPRILGKSYVIDDEPETLVGVMPPRFEAYDARAQIWIPLTWTDHKADVDLLGRLRPGVTLKAASSEFDAITKRLAVLHPDDYPKHFVGQVESAEDFFMGPRGGGATFASDMKHLVYDLLVAVIILLLIACSNVANLLLARATAREKEIAVRSALGATRGRLIRQLLVESSLLAASACVVGCLFAWLGTKFASLILQGGGPTSLRGSLLGQMGGEVSIGLNVPVLAFTIAVAVLTTFICGLAPALHAARADVQPHLSGGGKGVRGKLSRGAIRAGLVISEVGLSIVLLTGAGLMIRTLFLLTHVDLGFNPRNILVVMFSPPRGHNEGPSDTEPTSPQGLTILRKVVDRLQAMPGLADVSVQDGVPLYYGGEGPEVTAPGGGQVEKAWLVGCDENYLGTLGLRLMEGRWLSEGEVQTGQRAAVINWKLARGLFGDKNPVGQQLDVKKFEGVSIAAEDTDFQIVGVVDDTRGPQQPAVSVVFVPVTVRSEHVVLLLRTKVAPASLVNLVEKQVWAVNDKEIMWWDTPLTDFLRDFTYATPEFGVAMFAPLASIALLLVIAGVFSVMAYTVSLRTHEIGIRMALGAQQGNILRMVLLRGLRLVAAGTVVGVAASLELTRFIASQIWGVSATDPWTFGGVAILLTVVAGAACWIPARRAMRIEPMEALRYE